MRLHNGTHLDTRRLEGVLARAVPTWPHDDVDVLVRYGRGADFSGKCFYDRARIHVNLGRGNRYPYLIKTMIAKTQTNERCWWRELYTVEAGSAYELVLFVFMHEFYHWLVRKARRNVRQKEARCDRFAARALVDGYGAKVRDTAGRLVARPAWDFQDLDGFVAAALGRGRGPARQRVGAPAGQEPSVAALQGDTGRQLVLFGL